MTDLPPGAHYSSYGWRACGVAANEWLLILGGIASAVFGLLLFSFLGASMVVVSWLAGIHAAFFGALELGLAFWPGESNGRLPKICLGVMDRD